MIPARYEEILALLGVEVVDRTPRRLWARCPSGNHDDRHPSWSMTTVGPSAGCHYCPSCKWGDSLVGLVMRVRNVAFRDAKAWLDSVGAGDAERAPVQAMRLIVPRVSSQGFRLPPEVIVEPLSSWPSPMRRYAEHRGITATQVDRWGIGFAVEGRLAGRIVLVARDASGRPAGYTGRTIGDDPRRYCNAREEERPDPKVLFGEENWSGEFRTVVVTEGALNALAVERALPPFPDVAALSGSRVHPAAVDKLARFSEVVLLTDPDRAGDEAAHLFAGALARVVPRVVRVRLPEGEDAASVSPDDLRAAIGAAIGSFSTDARSSVAAMRGR